MSHINNGKCPGCLEKFNKFPGFYKPMQDWFFQVQAKNPTFHCAEAGRGKIDQEAYFARKASLAHWLQSSHNFNAAIDTFFQVNGDYRLDANLYDVLVQGLDASIVWYGAPDALFKERPHFEVKNWKELVASGVLRPVE